MDRDNTLEKHLLSRSHQSQRKILELLEQRYSYTAQQKPYLLLLPTAGPSENSKPAHPIALSNVKLLTKRKQTTRRELRDYIKTCLANQQKLVKKIQHYNRLNAASTKPKKLFPMARLLAHYTIPCYDEFVPMYNLWHQYMQSLLFSDGKVPQVPVLLQKMTTADMNGSRLRVTESRNRHLVGFEGIVAWDSQHSYVLCVERKEGTPNEQVGGFRVIPKKGSLFACEVTIPGTDEAIGFTLVGSRVDVRPVDRGTKKFKNHDVADIL